MVRVPAYYFHANVRTTPQHTFERSCRHSKVYIVSWLKHSKVIGRYPDQYNVIRNVLILKTQNRLWNAKSVKTYTRLLPTYHLKYFVTRFDCTIYMFCTSTMSSTVFHFRTRVVFVSETFSGLSHIRQTFTDVDVSTSVVIMKFQWRARKSIVTRFHYNGTSVMACNTLLWIRDLEESLQRSIPL